MERFTSKDLETMERLMDAYGVNSVLENMAQIAHEKSDHIMTNYQDAITAGTWDIASTNLAVASEFVFSHVLTIRRTSKPVSLDENIGSVKS